MNSDSADFCPKGYSVYNTVVLGNGDMGVVIGGLPEDQRFYVGKNDFWSQVVQTPMTVGGIELRIPALTGATYQEEEDLFNAEVRGTFTKANLTVRTVSWVAANENLLVTEIQASGGSADVHATLFPKAQRSLTTISRFRSDAKSTAPDAGTSTA
jgi:hypothetical protein